MCHPARDGRGLWDHRPPIGGVGWARPGPGGSSGMPWGGNSGRRLRSLPEAGGRAHRSSSAASRSMPHTIACLAPTICSGLRRPVTFSLASWRARSRSRSEGAIASGRRNRFAGARVPC